METLVLLVVALGIAIAVIMYYVFSLPSTKFKKAAELISNGQYEDGRNILTLLVGKLPNTPLKIAESFLLEGLAQNDYKTARGFFLKVLEIENQISNEESNKHYLSFKAQAIYEVAKIDLISAKSEKYTRDLISILNNSLDFLSKAGNEYIIEKITSLRKDYFQELIKAHKTLGEDAERHGQIDEALTEYSTIIKIVTNMFDITMDSEISVRIAICHLKINQPFDQNIFNKIGRVDSKIKKDFYFRYAKKLATDGNYSESEKILLEHFDTNNIQVSKLLNYIHEKKLQIAALEIEKLNNIILNRGSYSINELNIIYTNFDKKLYLISEAIPSIFEKINQIKPIIFKRILADYLDNSLYEDGLKIIKEYPNFWNYPDILRNAAICAFHIARKGLLSHENYKDVISIWLTSVFCNDIIHLSILY
jgi:tetratricopeptide (TPR) repeat protein